MALDLVALAIIDRFKAALANQLTGVPAFPLTPDTFNVILASPDEGAANADLVMFLYLITPDADLRNAERIRPWPNPGDAPSRFAPAVPLELRFLVTTGMNVPGPKGLSMLAAAIRAIEAGSPLALNNAFDDAVWLSLLPLSSDEMARIWGLFPNENCRSSFAFRASPVWVEPRDPVPQATNVSDDRFHSGSLAKAGS